MRGRAPEANPPQPIGADSGSIRGQTLAAARGAVIRGGVPANTFHSLRRLALVAALALCAWLPQLRAADLPRVLVCTRNGPTLDGKPGYVHQNIPACVAAIRAVADAAGLAVDVTDDPAVFTSDNLRRYRAVVLANTNNELFATPAQREAFQGYLRAGGGVAAIHSACGSMRDWPWFWSMLGGTFVRHPPFQEFTVQVRDRSHPSTAHYGASFLWNDEFYYLREMPTDLHVLLEGDLTTLKDPEKPAGEKGRPLAWCHEFEGGRVWYTALGHAAEAYADPAFRQHLLGGIRWAMGLAGK